MMIRIGVIGAGAYGHLHLTALKGRERRIGDVKLAGFADLDTGIRASRAQKFECNGYADYREMIETEKLDAVTIATPDHKHFDVTMKCLSYRIPLLIEKPLATKSSEAREMVKAAADANVFMQVDFHKRFDPYHIDVRKRIADEELGTLQYGHYWIEDILEVGTNIIGKNAWGKEGSPVWFLGVHAVDLSLWLMDFPKPTEVYAKGFKGKLRSLGIDIYDSIKATVSFTNDVSITYDTSVILPNSYEARVHQGFKMLGTEGIVEIDSQYRGARHCVAAKGMETPNLGGNHSVEGKDGTVSYRGYVYEALDDFVENVNLLSAGKSPEELKGLYPSSSEAVISTEICEAIHESIRSNRVVAF